MKVEGRRVAVGAVVVGALVIAWAGYASEEKVREQWYLWKLDSSEEEERELAAERLGKMRSAKAIPQLIEILRHAPQVIVVPVQGWDGGGGSEIQSVGSHFVFRRGTNSPPGFFNDIRSHYGFEALVRIGRPAVPALLRLLEDKHEWIRWVAATALEEIDPQEGEGISALRETLEDSVSP